MHCYCALLGMITNNNKSTGLRAVQITVRYTQKVRENAKQDVVGDTGMEYDWTCC